MNVLDLFSKIGGFSLGLERAGMRTVAFCEIEPFATHSLQIFTLSLLINPSQIFRTRVRKINLAIQANHGITNRQRAPHRPQDGEIISNSNPVIMVVRRGSPCVWNVIEPSRGSLAPGLRRCGARAANCGHLPGAL